MIWIYLFLIALFIRPQDWPGTPVYGYPLIDVFVVGGMLSAIIYLCRKKRSLNVPQVYLVLIFVVLTFLSNAVNGDFEMANMQFVGFLKRCIVFFIFLVIVDTPEKIKRVLLISMLIGMVLSIQGHCQSIHGVGWAHQTINSTAVPLSGQGSYYSGRTFWIGAWDGPNVLCLVYLMTIPFALMNIFDAGKKVGIRFFYLLSFFVLGYGIFLTDSRGGFLTLGAITLIFFLKRFGVKRGMIGSMLLLPIFLIFSPGRMAELNSEETSAHERTWLWEQGLEMARTQPLLGIGTGQFVKHAGLIAHNNFLSCLAEMGFLGLLVYVSLLYASLKCVNVVLRQNKTGDISGITEIAVCVGMITLGFYIATFFVVMLHDMVFIYWALCGSVYLLVKKDYPELNIKLNHVDIAAIVGISISIIIFIWLIAEKEIF